MDISNAYHIIAGKLLLWLKDIIRLFPNVVLAALILAVGFFLAGKLKYLISKVIKRIIHIEALDNLVNSIIYIFLLGLTVFMALSVLQLDKAVTSILAGAGILGLALAFAFQDIAANFMSGIFMSIRRPFFKGDIVKVKDYMGRIEEINLRDIVVRTFQGQMVIIPNKEVLQNPIENYSLLGKRRMDLSAGVSYGDDLDKAKEVAINAVKDIERLSKEDEITFFYTEVENDRRALNVFHGMRRARKEGRWMASAPIGYLNKVSENGRKYISPKEPENSILKWCFEKLATAEFSTEQIWKVAREKGLKCGKNNFLILIRNPVYYGKITIPKYKNEDSYLVQGQHEPLISERLFNDVQDALDGRKREPGVKIMSLDELPLRGFLLCSRCSRVLTGSASKGRNQYYYYYHCSTQCGCRYKADTVNEAILLELKKYSLAPEFKDLCTEILIDVYNQETNGTRDDRKSVLKQIDEQNDKLRKARELMLTSRIEPEDYTLIKKEIEVLLNNSKRY